MKNLTNAILFFLFSISFITAQEYHTEIENDPLDIQRALDEVQIHYGFDNHQIEILEILINRRFDAFNVNENLEFPSITHSVSAFTSVNIETHAQEDYYFWINHYNIDGDEYKEQHFQGSTYSYRDPLLSTLGYNVFTVIRFSPKAFPLEQSNKLFFIITDMDRL